MPPVVGAKYLQKECFVVFFIPHRHKRGTTAERTKEVERGGKYGHFYRYQRYNTMHSQHHDSQKVCQEVTACDLLTYPPPQSNNYYT